MTNMFRIFVFTLTVLFITSCSNKVYFSTDVRKQLEDKKIPINKLQFYVDRDVELRRELSSEETKTASSGIVRFENGKYIEIIKLRMLTAGVCTSIYPNKLNPHCS